MKTSTPLRFQIATLSLLTLLSPLTLAGSIAWTDNKAGGKIVLENSVCYSPKEAKSFPGLYNLHAYAETGESLRGCWRPEDDTIHIVWDHDGSESYLPFRRFFITKREPLQDQTQF